MNFVGHVGVVARLDGFDRPDVHLGAALPDLAAMARLKLDDATGELGRGIWAHHAADEAFHGLRWFREATCVLRDRLLADDVPLGPARACAHAGVELVLDGVLVEDARTDDAVRRVLTGDAHARADVVSLVDRADRPLWSRHLDRLRGFEPRRYGDPAWSAQRLRNATRGRARIELAEEHVVVVARALDELREATSARAHDVVDEVARAVVSRADASDGARQLAAEYAPSALHAPRRQREGVSSSARG